LPKLYLFAMRMIWTILPLALNLLCFSPAFAQSAQTREEVERSLVRFPPDQRVYERFRYWLTMQPVDVQRSPDGIEKFRGYLKTQGFDGADIEAQLTLLVKRG